MTYFARDLNRMRRAIESRPVVSPLSPVTIAPEPALIIKEKPKPVSMPEPKKEKESE